VPGICHQGVILPKKKKCIEAFKKVVAIRLSTKIHGDLNARNAF